MNWTACVVGMVTAVAAMVAPACNSHDPTPSPTASSGAGAAGGAGGGKGGGGGGGKGGGGGGCVSGLQQAEPACTSCQDARCCTTATAAADNPGTWTNSAAEVCRQANCFAECGVPEPDCGGIVPSPASCTEPLRAACCPQLTACGQNDACVAIIYLCIDDQGCTPGQPCFDDCLKTYAEGAEQFNALDACAAPVFATCG